MRKTFKLYLHIDAVPMSPSKITSSLSLLLTWAFAPRYVASQEAAKLKADLKAQKEASKKRYQEKIDCWTNARKEKNSLRMKRLAADEASRAKAKAKNGETMGLLTELEAAKWEIWKKKAQSQEKRLKEAQQQWYEDRVEKNEEVILVKELELKRAKTKKDTESIKEIEGQLDKAKKSLQETIKTNGGNSKDFDGEGLLKLTDQWEAVNDGRRTDPQLFKDHLLRLELKAYNRHRKEMGLQGILWNAWVKNLEKQDVELSLVWEDSDFDKIRVGDTKFMTSAHFWFGKRALRGIQGSLVLKLINSVAQWVSIVLWKFARDALCFIPYGVMLILKKLTDFFFTRVTLHIQKHLNAFDWTTSAALNMLPDTDPGLDQVANDAHKLLEESRKVNEQEMFEKFNDIDPFCDVRTRIEATIGQIFVYYMHKFDQPLEESINRCIIRMFSRATESHNLSKSKKICCQASLSTLVVKSILENLLIS